MNSKFRARCGHNLLLLRASELAQYCLSYSSRILQGQRIHEHIRRGRHDGQSGCSPLELKARVVVGDRVAAQNGMLRVQDSISTECNEQLQCR